MASENPKCVGVVFSDRAYKDIQTETYDKDPVETGGILLGHVLSTGHWVVVEVIPPGDNSTHQYAYFEYDEHFVNRVADPVANKYEQKLELLGLWHRHPGSMDFFSGTDDGTNKKFAEINPAYGAISGLVNIDPEFRMTMYHVDSPLDYTKVETFVGDDIIPAELLKLKESVTFEDIDAIKKPKTRSEQQPAAPQQQTQQTRQTTPNREEPRRTAPNREHHEKPQVVIQRPETLTGVFKKLILEHTTAFCFLVASVVVVLAGVFIFSSSQKTELRKEEIAAETKKLEEERNAKEAEIKKAEEERKTEQAKAEQAKADAKKAEEERKAEQAKADAKKAEEERKAEQAKAQADTEKAKAAAAQAQAQAEKANASAVAMSEEGREKENAPSERQDAGNPAAPNTPAGNGNNNEKECAKLLENDGDFKKAEQYYKNELLNHQGGSSYKKHLENLKKVHTKVSNCNEQKQEVQDLINKIDPEKLKQKVEKADCNQKEDCKVLDTINTCNSCNAKGKYEDPIKKWEEKCKIKCSKK